MTKFNYSQSEFNVLLSLFQKAIDDGEYTEKIPYETWRRLKKLSGFAEIEYESPFVRIRDCFTRADGAATRDIIYSAKTYNWGFGRFFYDYVIKEKHNMTITNGTGIAEALAACDKAMSATTAVSAIDCTKATSADGIYWDGSFTGKSAYDSNDCYIGDKADSTYNYGTTTADTVKIAQANTIELNIPSLDYLGYRQVDGTWDSTVSKSEIEDRFNKLEAELQKKVDKTEIKKENDTMMKGINFDFGPCGSSVRLSMYGLAIQNVSGEWVSYNTATKEIMNVDIINMAEGGKYIYKMPVAISEVQVGDIIVHAKIPMFVTGINSDGSFNAIDVRAGEAKCILATRSPFGFNFVTKVVNLFGNMLGTPTADQPFGNMLPFLMLSGENKDIDPMMMFFLMGQQGGANIMSNPMMLYFLAKDNKEIDPLLLMAMSGGFNLNQSHTCKCHQKTAEEHI